MRPFPKEFPLLKGRCQAHKTRSEKRALIEASCSPSPLLVTRPPFPAGLPPGTPRLRGHHLPGLARPCACPLLAGKREPGPESGPGVASAPSAVREPSPSPVAGESRQKVLETDRLAPGRAVQCAENVRLPPGTPASRVPRPSPARHQQTEGPFQ